MNILIVVLVLIALMVLALVGIIVTLVLHSKQLDEHERLSNRHVFPAAAPSSPVPASQHLATLAYIDTI